ncbi:MAG: hypothetical protein SGBAC_011203 [Bacillariaceae sp.]
MSCDSTNSNTDEQSKGPSAGRVSFNASTRTSINSTFNLSNRTDILEQSDREIISPDMIYEQRAKMEEKMAYKEDKDNIMEQQLLQPVKKESLQPPPTQEEEEEEAHQASVQDCINQRLQARAQTLNIDLNENRKQRSQTPMQKREPSISFPSCLSELEHPPNLPLENEASGVLCVSDRTNPLEMSDRDTITPSMIHDQRAKEQAKLFGSQSQQRKGASSSQSSSGESSIPGAIRIGSDSPIYSQGLTGVEADGAPKAPNLQKVGSLVSLDEHRAVEAKLVDHEENSDFFKAKLEEEAELYREQMRKEMKEERENSGIVIATVTKDDPCSNLVSYFKFHKYKILGFLVLLAGGIVATVLIAFAPESTPGPTSSPTELPLVYDPPTAEACLAISQGKVVEGQDDMVLEVLDVEVDVSLDSEHVDTATLLASLEAIMKERLVPAFSECPFEEPNTRKLLRGRDLGSDNPKYAIANTVLEFRERQGVSCNEASIQPCHRIVMKVELFLKGHEYVSTLMNMVYDVGLKRPLVVTLGVGAPYVAIDFVAINSVIPSASTLKPTELPLFYDPATPQDCESVALGLNLEGQEDMSTELLDVEVDVTLDSDALDIVPLLQSLEDVMQERLVPALSHCPFEGNIRRSLERSENSMYAVANTFLKLEDRPGVPCSERSPQPCHRIVMKLELFLKGHEYVSTLMNLVYDLRKDRPVVETLGLGSPYVAIDFVAINSGTSTTTVVGTVAPTTVGSGVEIKGFLENDNGI